VLGSFNDTPRTTSFLLMPFPHSIIRPIAGGRVAAAISAEESLHRRDRMVKTPLSVDTDLFLGSRSGFIGLIRQKITTFRTASSRFFIAGTISVKSRSHWLQPVATIQ
jgi:hypothetical protein